tara:strand:- start:925 stop:1137 length:213 start_codon:yes stop_codon:yes gene_type:complete
MKLEALRSFGLKGVAVQVGEVVEASPTDARQLLNSGQAKEAVVCEVQSEPSPPKPKTPRKPKKPTPTSDE